MKNFPDKLAVALDSDDRATFNSWCRLFGPTVGVLKVGLQAYVQWGPAAVEKASAGGANVFLDLKLHDIPNTVSGAVRAARAQGVDYLTVHAAGGRAMLEAAAEAAGNSLRILAVTVLTHLDAAALQELDLGGSSAERAQRWASLAADCGCAGAVCSPLELAALRPALPAPFLLVTPGIRPAGTAGTTGTAGAADDQRRTSTPAAALAAGSDLLVVGRPLTQAADPEAALAALAAEMG